MDGRRAPGRWFPRTVRRGGDLPAPTNDGPNTGASIRIGSATGISGPGFILWPLGNGQARIRAYAGWSGAPVSAEAVTALRTLAEGAHILTPSQWLATKPELIEQENNPAS